MLELPMHTDDAAPFKSFTPSSSPLYSVPGPGRTIASVADPLSEIFRTAVANLECGVGQDITERYKVRFGARDQQLCTATLSMGQIVWAIAGIWAVARIAGPVKQSLTIREAEEWFFGTMVNGCSLWEAVQPDKCRMAEADLSQIDRVQLKDLLPYIFDRHGPGSRRDVLRNPINHNAREAKRRSGVYYTPSDVADYMVGWVLQCPDVPTVLDPACGTGVFLLACARHLLMQGAKPNIIVQHLYGIDIDPVVIDAACFVLTACLIPHESRLRPAQLWHLARLNIANRDTLTLVQRPGMFVQQDFLPGREAERAILRRRLEEASELPPPCRTFNFDGWDETLIHLFPEVKGKFDGVIANPPYAQLGQRPDLKQLTHRFTTLQDASITSNTNSFIPFMELMWTATKQASYSAMVVPMSVAYNSSSSFVSLRHSFVAAGGTWTFRFFDRTPDSIFGDDIKQRVAIALLHKSEGNKCRIQTSAIQRWTSRTRFRLFDTLPPPIPLLSCDIKKNIPKIGAHWEQELYDRLSKITCRLSSSLKYVKQHIEMNDNYLAAGITAYNWLALYRHPEFEPSLTSCNFFLAPFRLAADWAYAVLASRLTYWLWRVKGDGFHVPLSFVQQLPYVWQPLNRTHTQLALLGRALWERAKKQPVVSVNGGRRTVSYSTAGLDEVDVIDELLLKDLSLPTSLGANLRDFVIANISVGREKEEKEWT